MFKQHFGMKLNPFDKEIDIGDVFGSGDLKELDSRLKYMLENRGIFLLMGEAGAGKTTAIRHFTGGLGPSLYKPCYLSLTTLTINDFYSAVAMMLGEEPRYRKIELYRQIQKSILNLYYDQRITPVIVIDEIHKASTTVLEDICMLFNYKMDAANPYVLILTGQVIIKNKLALNMCYPLRQRISIKYQMQGLSEAETKEYLRSRMSLAGVTNDIFTQEAMLAIHSSSGGYPRNINNIAIHSLMYAAGKNLRSIDEESVYQANMELAL